MATNLVCIKKSGMHTAEFFKMARKLFHSAKTYHGLELHRDGTGETCLYTYDWVKDGQRSDYLNDLQNTFMEHIAHALKLPFEFRHWNTNGLPDYHFSRVDTTGFRKSTQAIEFNDIYCNPKVTVELRLAMLAYDTLFGEVNDAEYDSEFLAKMRGVAKSGTALAYAKLVEQEKHRLEIIKEQKCAEIDNWYAAEVMKLDALRREKRRGICKKFNSQIDDARKMLNV